MSTCLLSVLLQQAWNPLDRQDVEPDTLYLLDVEAERQLTPGDGGLMPAQPGEPLWTKVVPAPGKFRPGLRCVERKYGCVWMPSLGLLAPDEFTLECWLKSDRPWAEVTDNTPFALTDERGSVELYVHVHGGALALYWGHLQDAAGPLKVRLAVDLKARPLPADAWVSLAVTFKDGVLRLYVDGKPAGEKSGLVPPRVWSDAARGDGLSLAGARGRGADRFTLSDLRISRRARVPGEAVQTSGANVLTVFPKEPRGGAVRQTLLGGLHTLRGPETEAMAKGVLRVLRTDKLLTTTPIKAGEPDASHPARGVSGRFAYDWQVVDRSLDYYKSLDILPYLSIDSTPSILGGKAAPFQGEKLSRARSFQSPFTPEIPNDFEAFGALVRDLVHHVVVEKKYVVPYWGVWNEPNGTLFWNNKLDDYLRLYEVCAKAVKSVDPDLKVGGPETGDWDPHWAEGLIKLCADKKLPLDFVSWHYYLSTVGEIPRVRAEVDFWSKKHGLGRAPELINGEWCWQIHNFPKNGYFPWRERNYFLNDWHAAFTGASLIEMQRAGVVISVYTNPVAEDGKRGFDSTGLMAPTHPWANFNVFRMWSRLGSELVRTDYDGRPGIFSLASRDASGRLTVLLAHPRYRKDLAPEVDVKIPGLARDVRVAHYAVDDERSNAFDAGPSHAELEAAPAPARADDVLKIRMRPRSVHLLVLEPGSR